MSGRAEERVQDIPVLRFRVGDMSPAANAEGEANGNAEGNRALTAPWKRERLGAIGFPYNGLSGKSKSDFGHGFGRYVTYMNIFSHPIADPVQCDAIEIDKGQNEVKDGDVFFTTSSETPEDVGMSSVWIGDGKNTYLNSFCFGYRPKPGNVSEFLAYLFRANGFRSAISFLAQGISRYNISKTKVMDIEIPLPDILEQQKIGSFFRSLDALIDGREKALGKLESLKKAMLQKMFPQRGAKTPELRFKGFEGEWEVKKRLGEVCAIRTGHKDVNEGCAFGQYPFFTCSKEVYRANTYSFDGEALLIAGNGEVGNMHYCNGKFEAYQRTYVLMGFKENISYIQHYLNAFLMKNLKDGKIGSSMPYIVLSQLSDFKIHIPSFPEQEKIGAYFSSLDALLAARREEVAKLRDLKKALLERMFV